MSGEYIRGRPQGIRCLAELGVKACGKFKLVHDGSEGGSHFHTRVYQLFLSTPEHPEGEFLNTYIKFIYDLRSNWADVSISRRDISVLEKIWDEIDGDKGECQRVSLGSKTP